MGNCNSIAPADAASLSMSERIDFLKGTPFFMYLDTDKLLEELSECFTTTIFVGEGEKMKREDSGKTYVVAKGEMELSTVIPSTQSKTQFQKGFLCTKTAGDIVNKKQTQKDAMRRVSKAKLQDFVDDVSLCAKVDTLLMMCDDSKFEAFLKEHENLRTDMEHIIDSDIANFLMPLPFLKGIKESQIEMISQMCKYEAFDESATLFNQGDTGDKLYIVLAGQCEVIITKEGDDSDDETTVSRVERGYRKSFASEKNKTKNGELFSDLNLKNSDSPRPSMEDENSTFLASMKPGDYFGETALMVNIPRTTTVKTSRKSLFLTISKVAFHNFVNVCEDVKERMNEVMKARMVSKLSGMDIPFMQGISPEMFLTFAHSVEMHEMPKDTVIFKEGDIGDRFYIVIHGEVRVETGSGNKDGNKEDGKPRMKRAMSMDIGHLGPGKYFGEMALVAHTERSATCACNTHAILMSVGSDVFHKIFDDNPQALCEFKLRCLQEKAELKHILVHPTGLNMFNAFLKKELADENIQFWVAVNEFKKDASQEAAKALYDKFISESGELQVNVPGKMRKEISKIVSGDAGDVNVDIFEGSQNEIYKLMVRDNFARFKKTPEFTDFFENLGIFIS